jgi:hypothetical protein
MIRVATREGILSAGAIERSNAVLLLAPGLATAGAMPAPVSLDLTSKTILSRS